jgi:hypothetical protein
VNGVGERFVFIGKRHLLGEDDCHSTGVGRGADHKGSTVPAGRGVYNGAVLLKGAPPAIRSVLTGGNMISRAARDDDVKISFATAYRIALCEPSILVPEIKAMKSGMRNVKSAEKMDLMRKIIPEANP